MAQSEDLIDVRQLMSSLSLDELNSYAEDYFAHLNNWNYHLSKPFADAAEAPQLLINFAIVLQGLKLCPGLRVLEFGAGTCWASRLLTQMGCHVIAMDVSPTALQIGAELFRRQPVIGDMPEPRFLIFDGKHIDLPAGSVDRVLCLDAFHHVANQEEVLKELSRVLVPGGIAGFAEPGPEHSRSPSSQREMRNFKVIENDINIREIWQAAQRAGFTDLELAIFNLPQFHLSLDEFDDFLLGGETNGRFLQTVRDFLTNQRSFFLYKHKTVLRDSRYREGLVGQIEIDAFATATEAEPIKLRARVKNTSPSMWLAANAGTGAVYLGCHVYDEKGTLLHQSYHWESLTLEEGRQVHPGETVELDVNVPPLKSGRYVLEFDLVSNDICWFEYNGSKVARTTVEIS